MRTDEQRYGVPGDIGSITIRDVRCACAVCGAHVIAWQGHALSGWCSVCGSYDIRALPAPGLSRHGRVGDQLLLAQQL